MRYASFLAAALSVTDAASDRQEHGVLVPSEWDAVPGYIVAKLREIKYVDIHPDGSASSENSLSNLRDDAEPNSIVEFEIEYDGRPYINPGTAGFFDGDLIRFQKTAQIEAQRELCRQEDIQDCEKFKVREHRAVPCLIYDPDPIDNGYVNLGKMRDISCKEEPIQAEFTDPSDDEPESSTKDSESEAIIRTTVHWNHLNRICRDIPDKRELIQSLIGLDKESSVPVLLHKSAWELFVPLDELEPKTEDYHDCHEYEELSDAEHENLTDGEFAEYEDLSTAEYEEDFGNEVYNEEDFAGSTDHHEPETDAVDLPEDEELRATLAYLRSLRVAENVLASQYNVDLVPKTHEPTAQPRNDDCGREGHDSIPTCNGETLAGI